MLEGGWEERERGGGGAVFKKNFKGNSYRILVLAMEVLRKFSRKMIFHL